MNFNNLNPEVNKGLGQKQDIYEILGAEEVVKGTELLVE